ncbi:hypothetical protein A3K64_01210 [Candidatus Micrarchaeota archaeon RBG_16_36_9]|nr:MAG: hypothetical protein A3K64_01210 [Candidatus Micrarchaeota archaeon RBG_16_36_9]
MSQDDQFVWISPKEERPSYQSYSEYLEHNGKWIIYGGKNLIEDLGSKILTMVGKDDILSAKFTRNPALKVPEGYEHDVHALIVYCDDRNNESVKRKLKDRLGVDKMFWKYDRETIQEVLNSKVHD